MKILGFVFLFCLLLGNGCIRYGVEIKNPEEAIVLYGDAVSSKKSTVLPGAQDDSSAGKPDRSFNSTPKKNSIAIAPGQPSSPAPETKSVTPAKKTDKDTETSPPSTTHRSPENFRRGPGMWRVFSRLSPSEQQELLKLQRTEPERFRAIMSTKADELYKNEELRRQELDKLTAEFQKSGNAAAKEELRLKIRSKLKEDFLQRLQDTRRDIESYKKRTAQLEAELQKREKNCEAIVDAILQDKLTGCQKKNVKN